MKFAKYHALGNDYLVIQAKTPLAAESIVKICHRNFGLGSDGILFDIGKDSGGIFGLRIFNPDGSEAEKSGNGLRIFARYLFDNKEVDSSSFMVNTKGGRVCCQVLSGGKEVEVEMGRVSFNSKDIPLSGGEREVFSEKLEVLGTAFQFSAASIGNPHCVIIRKKALADEAKKFGSAIEHHPFFPNRTNVQFVEIIDRDNLQIEIWERGAGYTLASGSSSSAAAAVAYRLGLTNANVNVHMPGGTLSIKISPDYQITMRGPVTRVADGMLHQELFDNK